MLHPDSGVINGGVYEMIAAITPLLAHLILNEGPKELLIQTEQAHKKLIAILNTSPLIHKMTTPEKKEQIFRKCLTDLQKTAQDLRVVVKNVENTQNLPLDIQEANHQLKAFMESSDISSLIGPV